MSGLGPSIDYSKAATFVSVCLVEEAKRLFKLEITHVVCVKSLMSRLCFVP